MVRRSLAFASSSTATASRCGCRHLVFFGPFDAFPRQADFPIVGVDAENLDLDFVANFDHFFGVFNLVVGQLRNMKQSFQPIFQTDEHTEIRDLGNGPGNDLAGLVLFGDLVDPRVLVQLFKA